MDSYNLVNDLPESTSQASKFVINEKKKFLLLL
jgi:hypothetical protein